MNTLLQRIKKAYHLQTDAEVADFLGIKPSTLSMQKNRGRLNLKRIIEKCSDLNKNWLLEGKGPMRQDALENNAQNVPIYSSLIIKDQMLDFHESVKTGNLIADINDELYQLSSDHRIIGYITSTNSLAPTLKKNDIAIIKLENTLKDGSIVLISAEKKTIFKRVENNNGTLLLKSDGENLNPIKFQETGNSHQVIGKLVWIMRSI